MEVAAAAIVRFWKQDMVQVGLAVGMFLALAVPLLLVVLVLWYSDYTGWRASSGFYTIGMSEVYVVLEAKLLVAGVAISRTNGDSALRLLPDEADRSLTGLSEFLCERR